MAHWYHVNWDTDDPAGQGLYNYTLIRFDDIFGPDPGKSPSAPPSNLQLLRYEVFNEGDLANVNEVTVDWTEFETWNSFGGEAGVQPDEYGASLGTANGNPTGSLFTRCNCQPGNLVQQPLYQ